MLRKYGPETWIFGCDPSLSTTRARRSFSKDDVRIAAGKSIDRGKLAWKPFPNDVSFLIGKGDYRRDWSYAQTPRTGGKRGCKSTARRTRFDTSQALHGTATLRLANCGARRRSG